MKIRFSRTALHQLDVALSYVENANPSAARKIKAAIGRSINRLRFLPRSCELTDQAGVRRLPIVRYPYVVFYIVDDDAGEVVILRVRHTSQNTSR